MKSKRRTEITVETHRLLVIRRRGLEEVWCPRCRKRTRKISMHEATQAGLSSETISHLIGEELIHLIADVDGRTFLCLDSILQHLAKGERYDEKPNA